MDEAARTEPLTFLGRTAPPWADVRVVTIEPGGVLSYDPADWRDGLVIVECGQIQLESISGVRSTCLRGDVMWLTGLPVRALHNVSDGPAVLAVVSRKRHRPTS
jgi:hypothetical protein